MAADINWGIAKLIGDGHDDRFIATAMCTTPAAVQAIRKQVAGAIYTVYDNGEGEWCYCVWLRGVRRFQGEEPDGCGEATSEDDAEKAALAYLTAAEVSNFMRAKA